MFCPEKEAENFLEKNKFKIVKRAYIANENELENALKSFAFPVVMKISGKNIVHKNALGGIVLGIKNEEQALISFGNLKRINGFEGVIIQEQIQGKEVLIGVKKTKDFGHAICIGAGGINTEKLNDVSFRIPSFDKKEAEKMILETKISKSLDKKEKKLVEENILKV
jgi:acyl-CoA synthetase (NDP forming)